LIVGITLMAGGVICAFLSSYQYQELQFEINDRLPDGQQFEPLFWSWFTHRKLRMLQAQVIPDNPRIKKARRFEGAFFCLFFAGVALVLENLK